jgi:hypothetical protein
MQNTGARRRATFSAIGRCAAALALAIATAALPALAAAQTKGPQSGGGPLAGLRATHAASPDVLAMARWALASGDTEGLPFAIVDKPDSQVFVFDADGRLRGASPALVGAARGDDNVPGIGKRPIASIRPEERITPAGRFTAVMGRGPKGEDILWVDYESALALHRVVTNVPKERRLERLKSPQAAERRITYGCINVPVAFYEGVVRPTFEGTRGIVYILPDSKPLQDVFASFGSWLKVSQAPGAAPAVH